jgi:hypothetical protein
VASCQLPASSWKEKAEDRRRDPGSEGWELKAGRRRQRIVVGIRDPKAGS